jgi:transposase InsO family protein
VIGQPRATQRRRPIIRDDEDALTSAIIRLATTYGRYGYRRITALLRAEGWRVNLKRVYRIWRREGLKVPQKQPKRIRLPAGSGPGGRSSTSHCRTDGRVGIFGRPPTTWMSFMIPFVIRAKPR